MVNENLQSIQEREEKIDKWNEQLGKKQEMIKNLIECKDREISTLK